MLVRKAKKSVNRFDKEVVSKQLASSRTHSSPQSNEEPPMGGGDPGFDIADSIKELVRLAREQGFLTYDDINDALPSDLVSPEQLDQVFTQLRTLEVEVVESAEAHRAKQQPAAPAEEEDETERRLDYLDDPIQMYMTQMGKTPLLSREQEVQICQQIERAEIEMQQLLYSFGFTAKEHVALAEKILSDPPRERFDRVVVDSKIGSREEHLKFLAKLVKKATALDAELDAKFAEWQKAPSKVKGDKVWNELRKLLYSWIRRRLS